MKGKAVVVILIVACGILGISLLLRNQRANQQRDTDAETILSLSNKWVDTSSRLDEQKQVNVALEKDLTDRKAEITRLTNVLVRTEGSLTKTSQTLEATKVELAKRDAKIAELESQNQALDRQATDLSTAITNLNSQIADTERKLAASEGDKTFLEGELRRLMAEKAELERRFNDLDALRAQVKKLKEEMSVARRLEWIRKGLFGEEKGAQKLMEPSPPPATATARSPHYDLNVEITEDGSVRVIPPLTNRPPTTP